MKLEISPPSGVIKNNGFTIIEVALVLAIAGSIFLVVFLALPALQNSQKDTARRQDVGRVVAALQSYEADNGSLNSLTGSSTSYEMSTSTGLGPYVGKLGSGDNVWIASDPINPNTYHASSQSIDIYLDRTCAPTGSTTLITSVGDAAVVVKLSSGNYYCASM